MSNYNATVWPNMVIPQPTSSLIGGIASTPEIYRVTPQEPISTEIVEAAESAVPNNLTVIDSATTQEQIRDFFRIIQVTSL